MIAYRITRAKYAKLDGEGARLGGGRWNSKGIAMVYTCQSVSLCVVEVAVHLPLGMAPKDYALVSIKIPEKLGMQTIPMMQLPLNWNVTLHALETQAIGDEFIEKGEFAILKVPSASIIQEHNFLLNSNHSDFKYIETLSIEPFRFDERLFVK